MDLLHERLRSPMPYYSFSECYQFIGRGIRVLTHPALSGSVGPGEQWLDIIYHAELGLDGHIDTIYRENDMDPATEDVSLPNEHQERKEFAGTNGHDTAERPRAFVRFERGEIEQRVVHDQDRMDKRREERELELLAPMLCRLRAGHRETGQLRPVRRHHPGVR